MACLNLTDFGNHRVRCESEKTQQKFLKSIPFLDQHNVPKLY